MRWMGNRASNSWPKTVRTSDATFALITISPRWMRPSNPQKSIVSRRRSSIGTGQPSCQEAAMLARVAPSMTALEPWNRGGAGAGVVDEASGGRDGLLWGGLAVG